MKAGASSNFLRSHYDKLIALLVIGLLLATLIYLGGQMGTINEQAKKFAEEIGGLRPANPHAKPVDVSKCEAAAEQLTKPKQLEGWANTLFVPETRVSCEDSRCRRPIPIKADVCPFCLAPQTKEDELDTDADGMADQWEGKYRLNPRDPSDAETDADGDGFTNIEEYRSGTDPRDPDSHPPIEAKLYVKRIESVMFNLRFKSVLTLPDGSNKFAVNTRGDVQTFFVKMGEVVEGFKVVGYEPKTNVTTERGLIIRQNASVLTLEREKNLIPLTMGQVETMSEHTAILIFVPDRRDITVRKDESFDLKGNKYKLIDIDSGKKTVVIERLSDGEKFNIRPFQGETRGSVQQ